MNKIEVYPNEYTKYYKQMYMKSPRTGTICELIQEEQGGEIDIYFWVGGYLATPPKSLEQVFTETKCKVHDRKVSFPAYKINLVAPHLSNWVAYN